MKLKLEKDIVFFDIESTGLSVVKDRIVQLAIIKYFADGRPPIERTRLINPTIPIPIEASDIHKITNNMVKDQPTFAKLAKGLLELIGDADFGGFNSNRFDIVMLMEEFNRAGLELDMENRRTIDVLRIFHEMEQRTLKSAYKFYCSKKLEGAHDALVDVRATIEVLEAQLDKYKDCEYEEKDGTIIKNPIKNDIQSLHDFVTNPDELDFQGKIKLNSEGIPCFTFGKYQNQSVSSSLAGDSKYYQWLINGDFAFDTKKIITRLYNEFVEQNNR